MNSARPIEPGIEGIQGILDLEKTLASPVFSDDNRQKFLTAAKLSKAVEESRKYRLVPSSLIGSNYSLLSKVVVVSGAVALGVYALTFGRFYGVIAIGLLGSRIFLDYTTDELVKEGDLLEKEIFGPKCLDEKNL